MKTENELSGIMCVSFHPFFMVSWGIELVWTLYVFHSSSFWPIFKGQCILGTPQQPTQKHPTHHPQPVYQNFSVNIDPEGLKKHHGEFADLRWPTPQNTAGLYTFSTRNILNITFYLLLAISKYMNRSFCLSVCLSVSLSIPSQNRCKRALA